MDVVKPPHLRRPALRASVHPTALGTSAAPVRTTTTSSSSSSSSLSCSDASLSCSEGQSALSLLVLPGSSQELLVGTVGGRVLKGAVLGVTSPPHEYISAQWWPGMQSVGTLDTAAVQDRSRHDLWPGSNSASCSVRGPDWLLGAVTSLSVCPVNTEAWVAGHSCGRVAIYSLQRSRPGWVWQQPLGAPVVAVR